MLLYVIRHGDPIYDPDTLTPKGKLQAAAMGKRLAIHGLDRVFVSPNGRARETCQPACDLLGLTPTVEAWTSEDLTWRDFSRVDEKGRRYWSFMIPGHLLRSDPAALSDKWYESRFFDETNAKAGTSVSRGKPTPSSPGWAMNGAGTCTGSPPPPKNGWRFSAIRASV